MIKLEDFLQLDSTKEILEDKNNILSDMLGKTSNHGEFKEYLTIGFWYELPVTTRLLPQAMKRSWKRLERILGTSKIVDNSATLVLLSLWPYSHDKWHNSHCIEILMGLLRKYNWQIIDEEYAETRKQHEYAHCLRLQKIENIELPLELKTMAIDKYTVANIHDLERNVMIKDIKLKIVGLKYDPNMRKLARQVCKKYPDLRFSQGDRPDIELKRTVVEKDGFSDDKAIAVNILGKEGERYQIGWLSARGEEVLDGVEITPNVFITDFLNADDYNKDNEKIIEEYRLDSFGTWDKDGEIIYWGKVFVRINTTNIK